MSLSRSRSWLTESPERPAPTVAATSWCVSPLMAARSGSILSVIWKTGSPQSSWTSIVPGIDRIFAFHINRKGLHSLSTFWEYENEIKTARGEPRSKLRHIKELLKFDRALARKFDLRPERLDKYHRCASCFIKLRR